ncbi:MAG: hypothetical protein OQK12_08875 [Motiliproteus sp.]|nr:hypothetical protein [Motiliproteus sp.]MCW9052059.1 hypothetical protein [Motiliproteus sp.]
MRENERVLMSGLVLLLVVVWLGFTFHADPQFAGSALGGLFGVIGALLMLLPLFYLIIKRIKSLKTTVTRHVSMRSMLAWHIYAGVVGPILVMIHTGHKFNSVIGIGLTAMTLIVVLSGFVGRYLLSQIGGDIKDKKQLQEGLKAAYRYAQYQLQTCCAEERQRMQPFAGFFSRLLPLIVSKQQLADHSAKQIPTAQRALMLSDALADVQYSIAVHERVKQTFMRWLKLHIAISSILYLLLVWHIFSGIYFGLRWFD